MSASGPIRLGGRAELPSGDLLVWSVADGRLGRRWRESTMRDGAVARTILVETEPNGNIHRLEIGTAAGLLTLHPDRAGELLHGNVVTPTGMRHLTLAWGSDRAILVDGSPALVAITIAALSGDTGMGDPLQLEVLRIDDRLDPAPGRLEAVPLDSRTWRLAGSGVLGGEIVASLDDDGLLDLTDRTVWPLES